MTFLAGLPDAGVLLPELSPQTFALACRRTALQLIEGVRLGWTKRELAEWLTGPYARLVIEDDLDDAPPSMMTSVEPARVEKILETAREDLLLVLRELQTEDGIRAFEHVASSMKLVARAEDVDGSIAFVPRARRRMSLVERAMSLIAVDVLTNADEYTRSLVVCQRCSAVLFDDVARRAGACLIHTSGVVIKSL